MMHLYLLLVLCVPLTHGNMGPMMPPFFFLCHYHSPSEQAGQLEQGEIALSVAIDGQPDFYQPGKVYKVTVSSTSDFDGFMMTGLYTLPQNVTKTLMPTHSQNAMGPWSHNVMCAIVHSQMSYKPSKSLSFLWSAPPSGTGCVDFLATGSLGTRVVFKDILALQICEKGPKALVTSTATVNAHGVLLRDDFEGSFEGSKVWTSIEGGKFGHSCGAILNGNAATFCEHRTTRYLTSGPFSVTKGGAILQFVLSSGNCKDSSRDPPLRLMMAKDPCNTWDRFETIKFPKAGEKAVHVGHLPATTRNETVCLKWIQHLPDDEVDFRGCWAIDNVLVVHAGDNPAYLYDNFYPSEQSNWLFAPGGEIKKSCFSKGNAMVFNGQSPEKNFAATRDLNLTITDEDHEAFILNDPFDEHITKNWVVNYANRSHGCGNALIFSGHGARSLCTPFIENGELVGNIRFLFASGHLPCANGPLDEDKDVDVALYAETASGEFVHMMNIRNKKLVQDFVEMSVAVLPGALWGKVRFCWRQDGLQDEGENVWGVDSVRILQWAPQYVSHVLQFSVNIQCGGTVAANQSLAVEFSNNRGLTWTQLVPDPCLLPGCPKDSSLVLETWSSSITGWQRVTLLLPYAARSSSVRFRFRQDTDSALSNWAIDEVYIGYCHLGCSGHGSCTSKGCECDTGYGGEFCEKGPKLLGHFSETFATDEAVTRNRNFQRISGASLGYQCGVLGRGRALVFSGPETREAVTRDLNTARARYLELSLRIGSPSPTSECPSPSGPLSNVYIHHSCNGGILWKQTNTFEALTHSEPRRVSLGLPDSALGPSCRFRIWQPWHSGIGRDVWALDDVALTVTPVNSISVDFEDEGHVRRMTSTRLGHLGAYCGAETVVVFSDGLPNEGHRFLEVRALPVGPETIVQLQLAVNCPLVNGTVTKLVDSHVSLEFSTNEDRDWHLIHKPCSVPLSECGGSLSKGTIYESAEYSGWKRVTILLPRRTWSGATRLRLVQRRYLATDSWAVDSLYIGPSCKDLCSGHGQCFDGKCICDPGFLGASCVPKSKMPSRLHPNFEDLTIEALRSSGFLINGGNFVEGLDGCGTISSGKSLYFSEDGTRQFWTPEMDLRGVDSVKFFVRIGGGSPVLCRKSWNRSQGVVLQYSRNSGAEWHTVKELAYDEHRTSRLVSVQLPQDARKESVTLRWWQPQHEGKGHNQWALDDVRVERDVVRNAIYLDPLNMTVWGNILLFHSKIKSAKYCGSDTEALVFEDPEHNGPNFAITSAAKLSQGDMLQFKLAVGCGLEASGAVRVEYSVNAGASWSLVRGDCNVAGQGPECEGKRHVGSIYEMDPNSNWTLVVLKVPKDAGSGKVLFRWWQDGGSKRSFAIKDLYAGKACRNLCYGHGTCEFGICNCDKGYEGPSCAPKVAPKCMIDRFDKDLSPLWAAVSKGAIGNGCGVLSTGKSLYFSGKGPRFARTIPLDTRNVKRVEFTLRLGAKRNGPYDESCRPAIGRNGTVSLQYSTTNGLLWYLLKDLETSGNVKVDLPMEAKGLGVAFRWWQSGDFGEWALDNVFVAANDTNDAVFEDRLESLQMAHWYSTANARVMEVPKGKVLAFAGSEDAGTRYAETWDLSVSETSFIQFDLSMGLGRHEGSFEVALEYSLDSGASWTPVVEECLPPVLGCSGYTTASVFGSEAYTNWTRITMALSPRAISDNTRFRWTQRSNWLSSEAWALGNVYIGHGCPWLCSGHGYCVHGICRCDHGFGPPYCTPTVPLPRMIRESFDSSPLNSSHWPLALGGQIGHRCGQVTNGMSFNFYAKGPRMLVTEDLDLTNARFLEYTVKMGCGSRAPSQGPNSILLQYSNNGGITWKVLKDWAYRVHEGPLKMTVSLRDADVRTNATRFRFWQPGHVGAGEAEWALDSVYVGGMATLPNGLYDTFARGLTTEAYVDWPGGHIGHFCNRTGLVFDKFDAERSLCTLDMEASADTIIQFDIKIGCGGSGGLKSPVHLEYSVDEGLNWHLVRSYEDQGLRGSNPSTDEATVFYDVGGYRYKSLVLALRGLRICGHVRFRWRQEDPDAPEAPGFALSNVYIGPACHDQCTGELSRCHENSGCPRESGNVTTLTTSFDGDLEDDPLWDLVLGGKISKDCGGVLASGTSLVFKGNGQRMIVTNPLDLSTASSLQFHLRLGCGTPKEDADTAVFLQYSADGGMSWRTLEEFPFRETKSGLTSYVALQLPDSVKLPSVRLRWWQPSRWGTFPNDWAIDQIHIGSGHGGVLSDDFGRDYPQGAWMSFAGGNLEPVCDRKDVFLHFEGTDGGGRYAMTVDVTVSENSYIQFELVMGCERQIACYSVELQYSTDMGKTWKKLIEPCSPSNVSCALSHQGTIYSSDEYYGLNRIGFPLPYYARATTTRFRWIQLPPYRSVETWSLGKVYIGDQCSVTCAKHGHCRGGECHCDDGWHGVHCHVPKSPLLNSVNEDFLEEPLGHPWRKLAGGFVSGLCGPIGYGKALHFYGDCSRLLETEDLDLRNGTFISFYFKFGCLVPPLSSDSNVFLQVSTSTGWTTLKDLSYAEHRNTSFVVVTIPRAAKVNSARLRWWQPSSGVGARGKNDWALDEVIIGTSEHTSIWLRTHNATKGPHGFVFAGPNAVLETIDFKVLNGFSLQFEIEATSGLGPEACDVIDVESSGDFGFSWRHTVGPLYPESFQRTKMLTRFYPPFNKRRFIVPLPQGASSDWTRFRWTRKESPALSSWTISNLYVGPSCPYTCSHNGLCSQYGSHCDCDEGFKGPYCQKATGPKNPVELKETFEGPLERKGLMVTGGHAGVPCQQLKGEKALVFNGRGARSLETVDLDLEDAKFVQYVAVIGGASRVGGCKRPIYRTENVFVQFSVDAGMSWETLHEMDSAAYLVPRFDYIRLPINARTSRTRFRWWQMDPSLEYRKGPKEWEEPASWALDDILIGGKEINYDRITGVSEDSWWFHPYGEMRSDFCGSSGESVVWGPLTTSHERSVTTREVIVGEDYMLQFKMVIGCEGPTKICTNLDTIRLEYSTDPGSGAWGLLSPPCYPGNNSRAGCSPNNFHGPSVYGQDSVSEWTRITVPLPQRTFSGATQFRWVQDSRTVASWAVMDVYVGPACPNLCSGFGDCFEGRCVCDATRNGEKCEMTVEDDSGEDANPIRLFEDFEGAWQGGKFWSKIYGGNLGKGCGSMAPDGHGHQMLFDGCGVRSAVTLDLATTTTGVSFVLKIGCAANVSTDTDSKSVLLQYSEDNGIRWKLIAGHHPKDYTDARRVEYEFSHSRRIRLRWWQPVHRGVGRDQWALDNVEIKTS